MEREAPFFLDAPAWKVLEKILERKTSPRLLNFPVKSSKSRSIKFQGARRATQEHQNMNSVILLSALAYCFSIMFQNVVLPSF